MNSRIFSFIVLNKENYIVLRLIQKLFKLVVTVYILFFNPFTGEFFLRVWEKSFNKSIRENYLEKTIEVHI